MLFANPMKRILSTATTFLLPGVLALGLIVSSCTKEDVLTVSQELIEMDYTGGDIQISVQSTARWTVVANYQPISEAERNNWQEPVWYEPIGGPFPDPAWIFFDVSEGGAGTSRITVHVDASKSYSRLGTVIFKLVDSGKLVIVPIYQRGKLDREMSDLLSPGMLQYLGGGKIYFTDILNIKMLGLSGQRFDFMHDLVYFENLEELQCNDCGLTSFTTRMPALKTLLCSDNQITVFDPGLFPELVLLDCSGNPLESVEIFDAPKLRTLYCERLPFKEFSFGPNLTTVACRSSEVERIDLSRAASLTELDCAFNSLKELDASKTKLSFLSCQGNPSLEKLVLPEGDYLEFLCAESCHLSGTLTICSENIADVSVGNNEFDRIVFPEKSRLSSLFCDNNLVREIILPKSYGYTYQGIHCENNLLTELGVIPSTYGLAVSGNPGKDGVFNIYVSGSSTGFGFTTSWLWEGREVNAHIVEVPGA